LNNTSQLAGQCGNRLFINPDNTNTITITLYNGTDTVVTIPTNINGLTVTSIGNGECVFAETGLSSQTSITIPSSVTSIGLAAFDSCTGLTNITIPYSVTNIGDSAFYYCSKLRSIMIPDSVTDIADYAFGYCSLTNVTIPGSVSSIGDFSFEYCPNLTNATIANGVTGIGQGAFLGRPLTSVTIPGSVGTIGSVFDEDGYGSFESCANLTNVTICKGVATIGEYAFCECSSLASITIPGSVTSVGVQAFAGCPSLTSVYFAGNAPAFSYQVFYYGDPVTLYYLSGTSGWNNSPVPNPVLWNPAIQTGDGNFGINGNNRFGFTITNGTTTNIPIAVEARTNLIGPVWIPVTNVTLTNSFYFSDPQWTNNTVRLLCFRVCSRCCRFELTLHH
jgi:hypothetical protein